MMQDPHSLPHSANCFRFVRVNEPRHPFPRHRKKGYGLGLDELDAAWRATLPP